MSVMVIHLFLLGAWFENVYGRIGNKIIKYLSHSQPLFHIIVIISEFLKLQINFVEVLCHLAQFKFSCL